MSEMPRADIVDRIAQLPWFHSIDLGQGVVTPGRWGPPSPIIRNAFDTVDFANKKVIDIGCLDGLWSFEAERRGALYVHATDYPDRHFAEAPTLLTAKTILNSKVLYHPDVSVYDVPARFPEADFDVVIFCGVYYHLKDPLLAFAKLRQVLKPGGIIIVEGAVIDDERDCYASFQYRDVFEKDASNWWIPTIRCLREWVECSFFTLRSEHHITRKRDRYPDTLRAATRRLLGRKIRFARIALTAEAVKRRDPNYLYADEHLQSFDLDQQSSISPGSARRPDRADVRTPGDRPRSALRGSVSA